MDFGVVLAGLLTGGLYATIGLGLSLVFGVMRLVNLAHGEMIVVGAYAASLVVTWLGVDPFLSLLLVVPVVAVLAYPVQRYLLTGLLRRGLEPPLVATFGLSLVISAALTAIAGGDPRKLPSTYSAAGMNLFGQQVRVIDVVGLGIGVVLTVLIYLVMRHTRWGAALRAASTDPATAGTMGINVNAVYAFTFAASAGVAAIGGVFIGTAYSFTPTSGMGYILIGFTVVVLGGTGNTFGTLVGGLVLGLVQSIGGAVLGGQYRDFVIYAFFIVVLAAKPLAERGLDAWRNRPAAIGTGVRA
jgi:branched-chain amino acid transport system permease protein